MKLFDYLKTKGFYANDLRNRFKGGNIMVNGTRVLADYEISESTEWTQIDDFIVDLCSNKKWASQIWLVGLENIVGSNIDTDLKDFLRENPVLRLSKKQIFALRNA